MKRSVVCILVVLFCIGLSSCRKTCRCIGYNGSVDEFDIEELDEQGVTCEDKELVNFGRRYTYCKRVF